MKSRFFPRVTSGREDGAVLIFIVLAIVLMFVALTALAIDVSHLTMVRRELQNSADAAALAGAGVLINPSDGTINAGALTEAEDISRENPAVGADRDSTSTALDKLDVVVRIGHWSFEGTFDDIIVNENRFDEATVYTQLPNWESYSFGELNSFDGQGGRPIFINAVQVTTSREHTRTIFANIFAQKDHRVLTDAVGYIGFAASIPPGTVDIPFAVCKQFIMEDNKLSCGVARSQNEGIETGGWTNFSQDKPEMDPPEECESSNASDVNKTILAEIPPCEDLNTQSLVFGQGIGTINGAVSSTYSMILEHCFVDETNPSNPPPNPLENCYQNDSKYNATKPWLDVTMPVVDCVTDDYGGGTMACDDINLPYVGVVTLDIVWMSNVKGNVPVEYHHNGIDWYCSDPGIDWDLINCTDPAPSDPALCWQEFQDAFGWSFVDPDNDDLPEIQGMYFAPGCKYTEPAGGVGGANYGIMAKVPVLVE